MARVKCQQSEQLSRRARANEQGKLITKEVLVEERKAEDSGE